MVEEIVRQTRPARGHEVDGLDRAQRDHVVVLARVAEHADRAHGQEHGECLTHGVVEPLLLELRDEHVVRAAQEIRVLLLDLAQDPHAEAGPRERVPADQLGR